MKFNFEVIGEYKASFERFELEIIYSDENYMKSFMELIKQLNDVAKHIETLEHSIKVERLDRLLNEED